jgi:5-methylcytosine-specific restriction endonuclease McrA
MDAATRRAVRARAGNRGEYCLLPETASPFAPLEIEHIIPKKHRGDDSLQNLALACYHCNSHKERT